MQNVAKGLVAIAAVGFILAVVAGGVTGRIMGLEPEAFSRASNNLALLAIAIFLGFKDDGGA